MGDNDGGGGREEKKKKVPPGLWGPAQQLNGCKQHHSPHVQTFKISAHVMGSAWPLSGRTKHSHSFPAQVYRNGWFVPCPLSLCPAAAAGLTVQVSLFYRFNVTKHLRQRLEREVVPPAKCGRFLFSY